MLQWTVYILSRKKLCSLCCSRLVSRPLSGLLWAGFVFGAVLMSGCTKEVNLSLKSTVPQLVIEAVVSNDPEGAYVRLSRSQDFSDQDGYTYLTDALVLVSDSNRHQQDTLTVMKDAAGKPFYASRRIRPVIGHVYHLEVQTGGQVYTASSVMPDTVAFQGISLLSEAGKLSSSSVFTAVPKYVDRAGEKNYYRFEQYINHKKDPGISVLNDNVGDGLINERPIFTTDIDIHLGDTLTVVMIQMSQPIYQYFYQLSQNQDELGATPSNPVSNITGLTGSRPLGYFSAENHQEFTAIIEADN